jgi:4-amino-4-deoxy-L-arabinose transferase-like glycosyltransferase
MVVTSSRRHFVIIAAVALILRLGLMTYVYGVEKKSPELVGGGDASAYMAMAHSVYHSGTISSSLFMPRPPLFPALAGVLYHISGTNIFTIIFLNLLLNVLTCLLVYRLALTIGQKPRSALIAGLIAAVYPAMLYSSISFMTESLSLFLYGLALLLFARFMNIPNWRDLLLSAAVMACATLTRLTTLFLPLLLLVLIFKRGKQWRQYIAVFLIISALPGAVLVFRNWYYANIPTFSTQTQWMLLFMRATSSERRATGDDPGVIYARYVQEIEQRLGNPVPPLESITPDAIWSYFQPSSPEMQAVISQMAIEKNLRYPHWYILNSFYGLHRILAASPDQLLPDLVMIPIHYVFVLLACVGFWYYWRHDWRWAWLLGLSALWSIALTIALETAVVDTRHGISAALTMFVLASQGTEQAQVIISRWRNSRSREVVQSEGTSAG